MKIKLFKKQEKTKWVGIHAYNWGTTDYMVFARLNKTTGLLDFKTKVMANGTYGKLANDIPLNAGMQLSKLFQ